MNSRVHLVHLHNYPIFHQLKLEEALLRVTSHNWCIVNEGSPPAIVMGISGKSNALIDQHYFCKNPIPLIKRYSGGGTVVVDHNTIFVSFIFGNNNLSFPLFPEPILKWSESFYKQAFPIPHFQLKENDYTIDGYKCGGNAQYIQKNRFVHHSTFLWDYSQHMMAYLLYPEKTPKYRNNRSHNQFLCSLNAYLPSKQSMVSSIIQALNNQYLTRTIKLPSLIPLLKKTYRTGTTLIKEPNFDYSLISNV